MNMNMNRDNFSQPTACYQGHLGDLLVAAEQAVLKELFTRLFGLHLVWIGYNALLPVLEASLVQHKLVLGDSVNPHLRVSKIVSHPEILSIQPDSVDVVILAHALENSPEPHKVLREAHRILRPEGQLIITGFNPISLLGIWYFLKFKQKLLTAHRIMDWCQLFDLELQKKEPFFYRPPLQHVNLMAKMQALESNVPKWLSGLAGGYCLNFIKRVAKLTPIRPNWKVHQKEVWVADPVQNTSPHQKCIKK
jgi:SAM-dependent methyltransferase